MYNTLIGDKNFLGTIQGNIGVIIQPDSPYYCKIRNYKEEMSLDPNANLFSDIYMIVLKLGEMVSLILVPPYDRGAIGAIAELPKRLEDFTLSLHAYLYVIEHHENIITPNQELAGSIEEVRINSIYFGEKVTSIFYISNEEYETYLEEVSRIQDLSEGRYGTQAQKLKEFKLINFIDEKVIPSPSFQQ